MKVIMIGSHLRVTGGITRVVKNYLESGLPKKVNLEYFPTYYGSNHLLNIFYYVYQFLKLFIKLSILNHQYNVAHIHMSYRGSFVRKRFIINLLTKKNIPIILHMHGSQFKDFYSESPNRRKKQIKETLNKVTIILALGEQWKRYYQSISKTYVISLDNAVFPKQFNNRTEEKIYITTMGVLSKRKGTYDLIEVASKIKGKVDSKYKFLIAGDGEIEKVKNKIKKLNLEDMFVIPGWVSDQEKIDEIYYKSVIYVLPSYNEGMPMSILEAMSYGLPIISTNIGSIPSVVNEENGIIIKPGDIEALTQNIIHLLSNKKELDEIRRSNSEKVRLKYNIYTSVEELSKLYEKLTTKKDSKV